MKKYLTRGQVLAHKKALIAEIREWAKNYSPAWSEAETVKGIVSNAVAYDEDNKWAVEL